MTSVEAIDIIQRALLIVVFASAPPLLIGLVVGIVVSLFQAITSIQEPTLAFVPKIIAVFAAIYFFGGWMMGIIQDYAMKLIEMLPRLMGK